MAKKPRRHDDQLFHQSILDNIPNMVFVKEAKTLRFVRFNKAGEKLLGLKQSQLIGKNDYDLFPKKEADFFTQKDHAVLRSRKLLDIPEERIHTRKRGLRILHTKKIPLFDDRGKPRYLLGISEDITDRKNAEDALHKTYEEMETRIEERTLELSRMNAALKDSESLHRTLLSSLVEGVVVIDKKGTILSVNPGAERILGYSASQMVGHSAFAPRWGVIREDGTPSKPGEFFTMTSIKTGKPFANVVIGLHRSGGQLIWLNGNTHPLFKPGESKPYAVVTSFFDITSRKEMQAEIQQLNADLEHKVEVRTSELKAAISELESFSYSVSHDLRAPLRAIEGFSQILLEDHASVLNAEGRRLLGVVRKNTLQMAQLIDDLLSFSRIARKDFIKHRVPMNDLARRMADELIQAQEGERCAISIDVLPDAFGDVPLLRQVWTNLLSNAIKFSRPVAMPRISIQAREEKHSITYSVADNGVGFDMEFSDKLFGVFQRLHSAQEFDGTGVGLAIVHRIILKHGGRVWAEGKPGKGATFYFSLPKETGPKG